MLSDREMETAALWASRGGRESLSVMEANQLDRWLSGRADRAAAYQELLGTWNSDELLSVAGEVAAELDIPEQGENGMNVTFWRRPIMAAASLAAVLVFGALLFDRAPEPIAVTEYQTGVAERMPLALADGSQVYLNARSQVKVSLGVDKRVINLLAGEAFFDVAHDAARPFSVNAKGLSVTALGTKFDVDRHGDSVYVAVYEGQVSLQAGGEKAFELILSQGERGVYSGGLLQRGKTFDPQSAVDWRDDWVEMEDEPLSLLLSELRRYSSKSISAQRRDIANLRIGGRFRLTQVDQTLQLVANLYGFDISIEDNEIVLRDKVE